MKAGDKVTVGQAVMTIATAGGTRASAPAAASAPQATAAAPGSGVTDFPAGRAAGEPRSRSGPAEVVDISRGARPAAAAAAADRRRRERSPAPGGALGAASGA